MKNVENIRHLETEFCLNNFTEKNRYFVSELLIFKFNSNLHETVVKENLKNKIYLQK